MEVSPPSLCYQPKGQQCWHQRRSLADPTCPQRVQFSLEAEPREVLVFDAFFPSLVAPASVFCSSRGGYLPQLAAHRVLYGLAAEHSLAALRELPRVLRD